MNNLRERRKAAGFTITKLAKLCRVSRSYIHAVQCGNETPTVEMADRIEAALECRQHDGKRRGDGIPAIPFENESEEAEMRRIWCERYAPLKKEKEVRRVW